MPSRAMLVGDQVRVPWGLDILDGVVEDIYETGSGRRVVVRVAVPGASEDDAIVTLPAEDVQLRDEAESTSPGAWVTGARYERRLTEALGRLLSKLPGKAQLKMQPRISPDWEADFAIQSGPRVVLIEAKAGGPQRRITAETVHRLRASLAKIRPRATAGLLVTDREVTSAASQLLRETPSLRAIQWRGPRDDDRLAAALASLLSGSEEDPQA
jgi:hypothetical protein